MECPDHLDNTPSNWHMAEDYYQLCFLNVDLFLKGYDMANYFIVLSRYIYSDTGICGSLALYDCDANSIVFRCDTLEHSKKYIPKGLYPVEVNHSPKFNADLPQVLNVPNRDGIRIHAGNYEKDTSGCILVGKKYYNSTAIYESKQTLDLLMSYIADSEKVYLYIV